MSVRSIVLGASLAIAGAAQGQQVAPSDWVTPRLSTEVSVTAGKAEAEYIVRAKVVDLASSKVLATPMLVVAAGQPATVEMGSSGAVSLKMVFTVSTDGKTASYTNEIRRNGEIESSQRATLVVAAGA